MINRNPTDVKLKSVVELSVKRQAVQVVKQPFQNNRVRRVDSHVLQNMSSIFRFLTRSIIIIIINVNIHKNKIS